MSAHTPLSFATADLWLTHHGELYKLAPPSHWLSRARAAHASGDANELVRAVLGAELERYLATRPTNADGKALGAQLARVLAARGIRF